MRAEQRAQSGDVAELRSLVDQVLRTRRYLDWRQTREYADAAQPVVALLERAVESSSSLPGAKRRRHATSPPYDGSLALRTLPKATSPQHDGSLALRFR